LLSFLAALRNYQGVRGGSVSVRCTLFNLALKLVPDQIGVILFLWAAMLVRWLVTLCLVKVHMGDDEMCPGTLMGTRRMAYFPEIVSSAKPHAMKSNMCGLKATCCDTSSFNAVKGKFSAFDRWIDGLIVSAERFATIPSEMLDFVVTTLSRHAFSIDRDFELLYKKTRKNVDFLSGALFNRNTIVHLSNVWTMILGYFTSVLCSICDPYQKLYLLSDDNANGTDLKLEMDYKVCDMVSENVFTFVRMFEEAISDPENARAADAVLEELCKYATDPQEAPSKQDPFPRIGKKGCEQMRSDIKYVRSVVVDKNISLIHALGCDTTQSCSRVICEKSLQGLGYSLEYIRKTADDFIDSFCDQDHGMCDKTALKEYTAYYLPTDAELDARGVFKDGPRVYNSLTLHKNVSRLLSQNFGCENYLSRYSCTVFPELTFTSVHRTGITITGIILGLVIIAATLFITRRSWCRWYQLPEAEPPAINDTLQQHLID